MRADCRVVRGFCGSEPMWFARVEGDAVGSIGSEFRPSREGAVQALVEAVRERLSQPRLGVKGDGDPCPVDSEGLGKALEGAEAVLTGQPTLFGLDRGGDRFSVGELRGAPLTHVSLEAGFERMRERETLPAPPETHNEHGAPILPPPEPGEFGGDVEYYRSLFGTLYRVKNGETCAFSSLGWVHQTSPGSSGPQTLVQASKAFVRLSVAEAHERYPEAFD